MQLYFVKATYSKNVYKIGDFFLNGAYNLVANKMLNINSRIPNDGNSFFITKKLTLPDTTDIRDHTHVIVPEYNKIFKIINSQYINAQQYQINLEEDPLIGNYIELETTDIILSRTNETDLFRGQNDVSDLALKETVDVKVLSPTTKSGKWALIFYQYNETGEDAGRGYMDIELNYNKDNIITKYEYTTLGLLIASFPEVVTDEPEKYSYYQETAYVSGTTTFYECVYVNDSSKLMWVESQDQTTGFKFETKYMRIFADNSVAKITSTGTMVVCLALPFESIIYYDFIGGLDYYYLSYQKFIGPKSPAGGPGGGVLDIKVVSDIMLPIIGNTETISGTDFKKELIWENKSFNEVVIRDSTYTTGTGEVVYTLLQFKRDFDISFPSITPDEPKEAEPFYKYSLYVYGDRYSIPYYLSNNIKILIAYNSGIINYIIYYNDKRNIIASGSFTHSIKYQVDQLDAFYTQNPTYKDQFYLKMSGNVLKSTAGGAIAGSLGGPLGTGGAAGLALATATVDAGLQVANLHYMEKGLALKPDQMFGDNSEVALQILNLFSIYWVKTTPENQDLMLNEYYLRGFPTSFVESIDNLTYEVNGLFGTAKVVFGEIKEVIRNEFTTKFINQKLKEGIILIP